jgi:signal transduction histidine kinase
VSFQQQVQTVADSVSSSYGELFFEKITKSLAQAVNADYCFIGRIDKALTTSKTISTFAHGKHIDNFEYELRDTPCAEVTCAGIEFYPENVAGLFPKDILLQNMGIEAYVGASLKNSDNQILGIVVALYEKKIDNPEEVHILYKLFSGRIAAEIDSNEKTLALKAANQNLEDKIDERTKDLTRATHQLLEQEKFASLATLVAGISHEINTPIGIAVSATSFIQDTHKNIIHLLNDKTLTENNLRHEMEVLKESINLIENNLRRAANKIINFKKIAVDQNSCELSSFQLSFHTQILIDSLNPEIKKHSVQVINNIPDDVYFYSYLSDYQQILSNLILNALTHGFDEKETGEIIIEAIDSYDQLQVSIHDTGKGIEKTRINNIYTPFYTSSTRSKRQGLGLSIVYNLVKQRFEGDIQVQSELGKGTTFTLTLPKIHTEDYQI